MCVRLRVSSRLRISPRLRAIPRLRASSTASARYDMIVKVYRAYTKKFSQLFISSS